MEVWDQESSSSDSRMADTTGTSLEQHNTNPLNSSSRTSGVSDNGDSLPRTTFAGDELEEGEFTASNDQSRFRFFLRYIRSFLTLLFSILLDLFSANNKSILSKTIRILATGFVYATVYTSTTGMLLWTIAYLMDHGWYLLAVTSSVVLLLLCCAILVLYEWMWLWQGRAISFLCRDSSSIGYNRLRSVNVLDDDEMEDDLTFVGLIRQTVRGLVCCLVWSLYCVLNIKIDVWITDHYILARPEHFAIELRLVNCFEAALALLGAAVLLYFAYPSFYRWNFAASANTDADTTIAFASTEEIDNEGYTIEVDQDNEAGMGLGMQNLII